MSRCSADPWRRVAGVAWLLLALAAPAAAQTYVDGEAALLAGDYETAWRILGPLADENLRRAMVVFEDKSLWFVLSRPIGTVLLLVVLYTFYDGIFRRGR